MNGPSEQNKSGSTPKQSDGPNLLAQVRARQASEQHREAMKAEKRKLARAKNEFRSWKRDLCKIIQAESEMVRNADGSFSFVLAPKITRLVYEVMLRDHMRLRDCSREEAENAVRQGFVGAVEEIDRIVLAQQKALDEAGELKDGDVVKTPLGVGRVVDRKPADEQEAAAALAKMREELVREQAGKLGGDGED